MLLNVVFVAAAACILCVNAKQPNPEGKDDFKNRKFAKPLVNVLPTGKPPSDIRPDQVVIQPKPPTGMKEKPLVPPLSSKMKVPIPSPIQKQKTERRSCRASKPALFCKNSTTWIMSPIGRCFRIPGCGGINQYDTQEQCMAICTDRQEKTLILPPTPHSVPCGNLRKLKTGWVKDHGKCQKVEYCRNKWHVYKNQKQCENDREADSNVCPSFCKNCARGKQCRYEKRRCRYCSF